MNVEGQIKKLNWMSPGINRNLEVYYLNEYLLFLQNSGKITRAKYNEIYSRIPYKNVNKYPDNDDANYSLLLLSCLYEEVLKNANNYNSFYIDSPTINYNKMLPYAIDFLNILI